MEDETIILLIGLFIGAFIIGLLALLHEPVSGDAICSSITDGEYQDYMQIMDSENKFNCKNAYGESVNIVLGANTFVINYDR